MALQLTSASRAQRYASSMGQWPGKTVRDGISQTNQTPRRLSWLTLRQTSMATQSPPCLLCPRPTNPFRWTENLRTIQPTINPRLLPRACARYWWRPSRSLDKALWSCDTINTICLFTASVQEILNLSARPRPRPLRRARFPNVLCHYFYRCD
jgi:hypothetical protein